MVTSVLEPETTAPARATLAQMRDPDIEMLDRSDIRGLQGELLARQVAFVYENSRFFRDQWDAAGVHPRQIRTVADLGMLPAVCKDDFRVDRERTSDPFAGTLCVPTSQLTLVTHSTGTSGRPNLYGLTPEDLDHVGRIFARASYTVGLRPGDHLVFPGFAGWHGATIGWDKGFEDLGVIKYYLGTSSQDHVIQTLEMGSDIQQLNALPAYQPEAEVEYIRTHDVDLKQIFPNLKLLWAAVDASPARRQLLFDTWGVPLKNHYGSGDQFWMSGECPNDERSYHLPEDSFVFEVLDPVTNEPVEPGGTGLLHITNLFAKGFPYIRYNMEDMVSFDQAPCSCGRTSMRVQVLGRLPWSVRVDGRYFFSQQVEDVLWVQPEMAASNYQLVRRPQQPQDRLIVKVVPNERAKSGSLRGELEHALSSAFGIPSEVVLVEPGEIKVKGQLKMDRVVHEPES